MPPRIIQWLPTDAFDEVFLMPRDDRGDELARRAGEIGGCVRVDLAPTRVYASGVNIDGGWIDVGMPLPVARIADGSLDEIIASIERLVELIKPARFVVREPSGAYAVHVADSVEIIAVDDWAQHLVGENEANLARSAISEVAEAQSSPRAEDLDALEAAARIAPTSFEAHLLLGRLLVTLGRDADARAALERANEHANRDWKKAPVYSLLGELATRRGDHDAAVAAHAKSVEAHRQVPFVVKHGVALIRAGDYAKAWETLRPYNTGRRLVEAAEVMAKLDRLADARALLRAGLEFDPAMLDPVAENRWPKPPELPWATRADLVALVEAARNRPRG